MAASSNVRRAANPASHFGYFGEGIGEPTAVQDAIRGVGLCQEPLVCVSPELPASIGPVLELLLARERKLVAQLPTVDPGGEQTRQRGT